MASKWITKSVAAIAALAMGVGSYAKADVELLNVSYDPTRELYQSINQAFAAKYKSDTNETITIQQSHGGSGKQSRAVIDGLEADVVTLALAYDIDAIADNAKLLPADWQSKLPNNSSPYTSTIVFVVRKGNPKGIKDWNDLIKDGVQVITANPKTGGGARWNYLAAWGYDLKKELGGDLSKAKAVDDPAVKAANDKAKEFVKELYKHVPVLDTGARGSTVTFAQRGVGDVLIAWENEAFLTKKEFGEGNYDIVIPSTSILAEPPVAVVDENVDRKGTRAAAEAYLKFLYTDQAQQIIAENHYRPRNPAIAAKFADAFPKIDLFTIDDVFGGWKVAQKTHFSDGGVFDQITAK